MTNSIFGQGQTQSMITPQMGNKIKQMMSMVDPSQSPQQMLQSLASLNPQCNGLINLLGMNGGDIRGLVTFLAQQKGVDLDALQKEFKALQE